MKRLLTIGGLVVIIVVAIVGAARVGAQCLPGFCSGTGFWSAAPTEYSVIDYTPGGALGADASHLFVFSGWQLEQSTGEVVVMWEQRTLDNKPTGLYVAHRRFDTHLGKCKNPDGFPAPCGPGMTIY